MIYNIIDYEITENAFREFNILFLHRFFSFSIYTKQQVLALPARLRSRDLFATNAKHNANMFALFASLAKRSPRF
jgi:hypothetical protein